MIDEKTFVEVLQNIEKQDKIDDQFGKALELVCDGYCLYGCNNLILPSLLNVLSAIFEDTGDWISWWIYEKEYGKKKKITAYDENKKIIPLNTPSQLYKFLIKNMQDKK